MICPKCGSDKVVVTLEQTHGKTRTRKTGCLWTLGRWTLIICTCGLWLLVGKRSRTSKTKFESRTVGLCQNCGNKFEIQD